MGPAARPADGCCRLNQVPQSPPGGQIPPGKLRVVVTYLEMNTAPKELPGPPPVAGLILRRIQNPGVAGYRFLYNGVGEHWLWHERRSIADAALAAILDDPGTELLVLVANGRIAGFAELDRRPDPNVKLAYFGLLPRYLGHGLGPWLLAHAIYHAWSEPPPRRLLVNTTNFDHPAALKLYHRAGFFAVKRVIRDIGDPRLMGLLPLTAAPHVELATFYTNGRLMTR